MQKMSVGAAVLVKLNAHVMLGKLNRALPAPFFHLRHGRQPRISAIAVVDSLRFLLSTKFMDNNAHSALIDRSWDFALQM